VVLPPGEEELADLRARGAGEVAQDGRVHGHPAPAEDGAAFLFRNPFRYFTAFCRERLVGRQEDRPDGVVPGRGKVEPVAGADLAEKDVRDADHDAGAVAGGLVAAQRPPVLEVDEHLDRLPHDEVERHPVDPGDEADSAAVVLVLRVVQPRRLRNAGGVCPERVVLHLRRNLPGGMSDPSSASIKYGTAPAARASNPDRKDGGKD